MLESMTGYGQSSNEIGGRTIKIEVKSLNSKFLDLNLRLPKELSDKEAEIRTILQRILQRGKVHFSIEIMDNSSDASGLAINEPLFRAYYTKYDSLATELSATTTDIFRLALQSPRVQEQSDKVSELDWTTIEKSIIEACLKCQNYRSEEGVELLKKFKEYISAISERLVKVEKLDPKRIESIRSRISKNLEEIKEKVLIDENRFEQELIYYVEKLDITEEKVRLKRHLDYFLQVLNDKESQGKKLGFISQELGREINTLGSKANDADIQQLVVEMKDELEKIKEQLLNIV